LGDYVVLPMGGLVRRDNNCQIFILAGGLSTRMGRDKSRVRLGSRTLLGHVREMAAQTGLRVRVIRRDAVARCGPIGGIYTGLQRSRAEFLLFLACDMPFISASSLKKMAKVLRARDVHGRDIALRCPPGRPSGPSLPPSEFSAAVFATNGRSFGFPILLQREAAFPIVARQIETGELSLQVLARKLQAKTIRFPARQLANINTRDELARAKKKIPR